MRGRAIGLVLLGVGAFLLAGALAVRLFLEPALVKLPLDQTASPTARGTGIDFFSIADQEQLEGLVADVRQKVQGDPSSEAAECAVFYVDEDVVDIFRFFFNYTATTEKKDYDIFNSTTKKAWPATF